MLLISVSFALAANMCCEKVLNGGWCENTDDKLCDTKYSSAPTSCALTSFCRIGCCFNSKDGLCYANYPKATCEVYNGTFDASDSTCSASAQCQEGCCIIGSEASLMTEAKCRKETARFPRLEMDFRSDITDELACINIARKAEKGCCVKSPTECVYGVRGTCDASQSSDSGFFADKYCSELKGLNGGPLCHCIAGDPKLGGDGKNTGCLEDSDDVYYMDSCGNPEGVFKECNYADGKSCGDSDRDETYECESLNCEDAEKLLFGLDNYYGSDPDDVSENGGVLNGESWCMYDSPRQDKKYGARDPPGTRYYRGICINGKISVEPCEDYRKEWCVDAPINLGKKVTGDLKGQQAEYYEARCRETRWDSCIDACNSLQSVAVGDEGAFQEAIRNDYECCMNVDKRDCKWIGPSEKSQDVKAYGAGKFPLFCVPFVPPGTKFWESEGSENCGKANLDCEVKFQCTGSGVLLGYLAGKPCAGGKASRIAEAGHTSWKILYGNECLKPEWIKSANDLCRSMGDCGADVNLIGRVNYDGFSNTPAISNDFDPYDGPGFLEDIGITPDAGQWGTLVGNYDYESVGKLRQFFSAGEGRRWTMVFIGAYATLGGIATSSWIATRYPSLAHFAGPTLTGFGGGEGFWAGFKGAMPWSKAHLGWTAGKAGISANVAEMTADLNVFKSQQQALTEVATAGKNVNIASEGMTKADNALKLVTTGSDNYDVLREAARTADQNYFDAKTAFDGAITKANAACPELSEGVTADNYQSFLKQANEGVAEKTESVGAAKKGAATENWLGKAFNTAMWVWTAYQLINIFMAKEEVATITTTCEPWVAPIPTKGTCEQCNTGQYYKESVITGQKEYTNAKGYLKCSEYKCKSFGSSCEIVNEGSEDEMCVSMEPSDVKAPLIDFWKEGTDKNLSAKATSIRPRVGVDLSGYKIPAYERVMVGIRTNEPSQCKMSFKQSIEYDKMDPFFFGSSSYLYFHQGILAYPNDVNLTESELKLGESGKLYELHVRCQDAKGNDNEKDYVIKFDIAKGPDITAPVIEGSTMGPLPNERYMSVGTNKTNLTIFVNERAQCRWGNYDIAYDSMPAENECETSMNADLLGYYSCKFGAPGWEADAKIGAPLSGIGDTDFKYFYFKCKDQPQCAATDKTCVRNFNKQSFVLTLRKSYALNITEIKPAGTIYVGKYGSNITMEAFTDGGAERNGNAYCGFSDSAGAKNNVWAMTSFLNTNSSHHTQIFSELSTGSHVFYIGCVDVAGNPVYSSTTFSLNLDTSGPRITSAYIDSSTGADIFKIRLDEKGKCEYTTSGTFAYGEGNVMITDDSITHSAQGGSQVYYVICEDDYGNRGSLTTISFLS